MAAARGCFFQPQRRAIAAQREALAGGQMRRLRGRRQRGDLRLEALDHGRLVRLRKLRDQRGLPLAEILALVEVRVADGHDGDVGGRRHRRRAARVGAVVVDDVLRRRAQSVEQRLAVEVPHVARSAVAAGTPKCSSSQHHEQPARESKRPPRTPRLHVHVAVTNRSATNLPPSRNAGAEAAYWVRRVPTTLNRDRPLLLRTAALRAQAATSDIRSQEAGGQCTPPT